MKQKNRFQNCRVFNLLFMDLEKILGIIDGLVNQPALLYCYKKENHTKSFLSLKLNDVFGKKKTTDKEEEAGQLIGNQSYEPSALHHYIVGFYHPPEV